MIFKIIGLIILSATKFVFAPSAAMRVFRFYEPKFLFVIAITTVGGIMGVLFFSFLTNIIVFYWKKYFVGTLIHRKTNEYFTSLFYKNGNGKKKIFTKRNRFIIKFKTNSGLWGLAFLSPVLLSVPLGTFITLRFFPGKKTIYFLCLSILIWSTILSVISLYFKTLFR